MDIVWLTRLISRTPDRNPPSLPRVCITSGRAESEATGRSQDSLFNEMLNHTVPSLPPPLEGEIDGVYRRIDETNERLRRRSQEATWAACRLGVFLPFFFSFFFFFFPLFFFVGLRSDVLLLLFSIVQGAVRHNPRRFTTHSKELYSTIQGVVRRNPRTCTTQSKELYSFLFLFISYFSLPMYFCC